MSNLVMFICGIASILWGVLVIALRKKGDAFSTLAYGGCLILGGLFVEMLLGNNMMNDHLRLISSEVNAEFACPEGTEMVTVGSSITKMSTQPFLRFDTAPKSVFEEARHISVSDSRIDFLNVVPGDSVCLKVQEVSGVLVARKKNN